MLGISCIVENVLLFIVTMNNLKLYVTRYIRYEIVFLCFRSNQINSQSSNTIKLNEWFVAAPQ